MPRVSYREMTEPEELVAKGDSDSNTFCLFPLYFLDGAGRLVTPLPPSRDGEGAALSYLPVLNGDQDSCLRVFD